MKKISIIAQFPPPIHGLSKAVETLFESSLKGRYVFQAVDTSSNRAIVRNVWKIATVKTDAFYFTISQTRGGLWRDIMFMTLISWRRKPMIIHLHGGYLRTLLDNDCGVIQRKFAVKAISKAERCIVLGDSLKWVFQGIVDDERIVVVPNCVDDEYMLPEADMLEKTEAVMSSEKIHVLYLSNFIATKGYREVLEVSNVLKELGKSGDFRFHFAGKFFDKAEEDCFFNYVEEHQLGEIVEYHGVVSGDAKRSLLRQCNVFMLLTRYPNEGQPISILEAMGNAMAVVTTDHAGIPDIATMKNGFTCSKDNIDVQGIVSYLEKCYTDREYLQSVCSNNYETVKKNYTQKAYIDNMEAVFKSVFNK